MKARTLVERNRFLCGLFVAGAVFVGTAGLIGSRVVLQVTPSVDNDPIPL